MSEVRYQFFLSSTFEDLREERQQVIQAVLEMGHIPVGMEVFPSADESPWSIIESTIAESDYYIVLSAGKYGSVGGDGISYTEREYNLASELKIPIIGLLHAKPGDLPELKRETDPERLKRLMEFHSKIRERHIRTWNAPTDLGLLASKAIIYSTRMSPRVGWIRADRARSFSDLEKIEALRVEISDLTNEAQKLEAQNESLREMVRSSVLPIEGRKPETLSQGDDLALIPVSYTLAGTRHRDDVRVSWDEIFKAIAPRIYGNRVRRTFSGKFDFETELKSLLKSKIEVDLGTQQVRYSNTQVDAILFQFKQLGYALLERRTDGASWTLTPKGEEHLTTLLTTAKAP